MLGVCAQTSFDVMFALEYGSPALTVRLTSLKQSSFLSLDEL